MKRTISFGALGLLVALGLRAQGAPDSAELTRLLKDFLAGASRNDAATHDRFWAEDVIYTRSAGKRIGKAEILRDVRSAPAPQPGDPRTTYTAEDIRIQQYGKTAVVAFRLVGATESEGVHRVTNYLNTGTFLKRNSQWRAVSWQATRMPRPEPEARKEAASAEAAFQAAMLAGDVRKLEALTDVTFLWTQPTGEQLTRKLLLERLGSGHLKYSKLDTSNVTIAAYGDTAIARGVATMQRASTSGSNDAGDAAPFTMSYTLTFVEKDGAWKAVAMHSSRS